MATQSVPEPGSVDPRMFAVRDSVTTQRAIEEASMLAQSIADITDEGVSNDGMSTASIHMVRSAAEQVVALLTHAQQLDYVRTRVTA